MITLADNTLSLSLFEPGEDGSRYHGTRFDHAGDFAGILFRGTDYAQQWFETYDPLAHDAIGGPAEEFSPIFLPDGRFLKIGVGILEMPSGEQYDHLLLYPVSDPGRRSLQSDGSSATFTHEVEGWYNYSKTVRLEGNVRFSILHRLTASGKHCLSGNVYNHNFFTLGHTVTGPERRIDFPFRPSGHWRSEYDSVALSGNGIRFSRELQKGESVYMGDLIPAEGEKREYRLSISEGSRGVDISSDAPLHHIAFWANHRIACPEPFNLFDIKPAESLAWRLDYKLH